MEIPLREYRFLRKHSYGLLLLASLLGSILFGSLLTAWHVPFVPVTQPHREDSEGRAGLPSSGRKVIHFVSPHCKCSERLVSYLASRPSREDVQEIVVVLGERMEFIDPERASPDPMLESWAALARNGYVLQRQLSREELEAPRDSALREIPGAPWLLIEDETGRVEYSGGYEVAPYWDLRILHAVQRVMVQSSLPATGCAASAQLRSKNLALRFKDVVNAL